MPNYKTDGIIIKRVNSGEADRLLTVITPYYGKIRLVAKGIRKITSQRGPTLELFNQTALLIHQSRGFGYVTEAKTMHNFEHIKRNLPLIAFAYQLCELVDFLTRESHELEQVYDLLAVSLYRLNRDMQFDIREFKTRLLFLLGFLGRGDEKRDLDAYIEEIAQRRMLTKYLYE